MRGWLTSTYVILLWSNDRLGLEQLRSKANKLFGSDPLMENIRSDDYSIEGSRSSSSIVPKSGHYT